MGRRLVAVLVVGAVALGWALAGAAEAGPQNTILVDQTEGPAGTSFGVQNTPTETCGVAPNPGDAVEVRMVDLAGQVIVSARAEVEADGAWRLPSGLTVPEGAVPGVHAILATCNPDSGGFEYSPGSFTVTEPVATTDPVEETEVTPDAIPTDRSEDPLVRAAPPAADIGWLIVIGTILFIATVILGWWLWRRILTSVISAVPLQRLTGWIAIIGAIVFTASWILSGLVQDTYSEKREYISALGSPGADYAWIMVIGFLVAGVSVVLLAFAGHAGLRNCGIGGLGPAVVLGLAGGKLFDLAVLRSDCSRANPFCAEAPTSWHHDWHTIIGWLTVLAFVVAAFWLGWVLVRAAPDCGVSRWAPVLFGVLMLCGPLFLAEIMDDNGLTQRNFLLTTAVFVAYLGWAMTRFARPPNPSS